MEYITVVMEDGAKVRLEVIDELHIEGIHYVIAGPENTEEAYAYRVTESNGYREYQSVGEGREFEMVLDRFNQMNQ